MVHLYTLPAKISLMVGAVEVSLLFRMVRAQVSVGVPSFGVDHVQKIVVSLDHFVENVYI